MVRLLLFHIIIILALPKYSTHLKKVMSSRSPKFSVRSPRKSRSVCFDMLGCVACAIILYLIASSFTTATKEELVKDYESDDKNNTQKYFQSASYLYRNSLYVSELGVPKHKRLTEANEPLFVAYYAPWCGHCRHFVPTYNGIAKKTNELIALKNSQLKAGQTHFKNITFGAVNCVDQKEICNAMNIEGYPTVIPFNIKAPNSKPDLKAPKNSKKREPERFNANADKIMEYIKSKYFMEANRSGDGGGGVKGNNTSSGELSSAVTSDGSITTSPNPPMPIVPQPIAPVYNYTNSNLLSRARYATPKERLSDGLASFNYLLLNELPTVMNKAKIQALINFLRVIIYTLPVNHPSLPLYSSVLTSLELSPVITTSKDTKKSQSMFSYLRGAVTRTVTEDSEIVSTIREKFVEANIATQPSWSVCGLQVKPTDPTESTTAAVSTNSRVQNRMNRRKNKRLRAAAKDKKEEEESSAVDTTTLLTVSTTVNTTSTGSTLDVNSDSTTGYTCGLWMLFHYVTVASAELSLHPRVAPTNTTFTDSASNSKSTKKSRKDKKKKKKTTSKPSDPDTAITTDSETESEVETPPEQTATFVMESIYGVVAETFKCGMCRDHFMSHYSGCKFQRCEISANDFTLLQMWLYHLHNFVTYGVYHEQWEQQVFGYTAAETAGSNKTTAVVTMGSGNNTSAGINTSSHSSPLRDIKHDPLHIASGEREMSPFLWPNHKQCASVKTETASDSNTLCTTASDYSAVHANKIQPPALTQQAIKKKKAELALKNDRTSFILEYLKTAYLLVGSSE